MNAHSPALEMTPVTALRPYAGNARTHSKKQIGQIADSISRFGFTNPVLIGDQHRPCPQQVEQSDTLALVPRLGRPYDPIGNLSQRGRLLELEAKERRKRSYGQVRSMRE
jgi:hypothetical protein